MEQIFMIEVFVKRVVLKVEPYQKDEYELQQEAEERKREEEAAAAAAALLALKKPKKQKKKPKKPKKGKKGKKKGPAGPSEEEMKFAQTCMMQMACLPLFEFNVAHDNFIAPPPPPPPGKKGKKGKKKAKPKPKKKKKGKKPPPFKRELPSDPLPQPPYFGVGNVVMFVSRPSMVKEQLEKTPLYVSVWNRDEELNCVGFCVVKWHQSFFECLDRAEELNPVDMSAAEFRNTDKPEIVTNTVEYQQDLQCEENLTSSGEVHFFVRLTCLGRNITSFFVSLPEMERLPGRKYVNDDLKIKDVEVVRHWEGTLIEDVPPIAYLFGVADITKEPIRPVEPPVVYEEYVAPYTSSELAILAMGFPKGPCGGTNCPLRMEYRGSQHQFIFGRMVKGNYVHGSFVNKRDVHGPCGRLDCPLAKKVREYLCDEGAYKTCKKPCPKSYY